MMLQYRQLQSPWNVWFWAKNNMHTDRLLISSPLLIPHPIHLVFYSRGFIVTHPPIQNFCLAKLQNARPLVYISLNHKSAYCISLPSSKDFDTCKTCGPKDPAFCKKNFYKQGMKYDCNWLPLLHVFFLSKMQLHVMSVLVAVYCYMYILYG